MLISVSWPFSQEVQWGVGGQPSCTFAHPSCLPSPDFSRYPFKAGSTLAKLTESRHWPPSQTEHLGTFGFEPASFQTKDPESSAPINSARTADMFWYTLNRNRWIAPDEGATYKPSSSFSSPAFEKPRYHPCFQANNSFRRMIKRRLKSIKNSALQTLKIAPFMVP